MRILGAALLTAGLAALVSAQPLYPTRSTEAVVFILPPEGQVVSGDGEFVVGHVKDAQAPFSINGQTVAVRPEGNANAEIATGDVEVTATELVVLNESAPLPFPRRTVWPSRSGRVRAMAKRQPSSASVSARRWRRGS